MKKLFWPLLLSSLLFFACDDGEKEEPASTCGDNTCQSDEDCITCPGDCGECSICGDGACSSGESAESCPDDCTLSAERCDDEADNDGDGLVDCDDEDCAEACGSTSEICDDGEDNDEDGLVDCDDSDCAESCGAPQEICDDGEDNDGDGLTDCDDTDCAATCGAETEVCDDGEDNDGDNLVDCDDSDCEASCGSSEICGDQIDNDEDGHVDCDDYDCRWAEPELCDAEATDELCNDGVDNDNDGYQDCQDHDCSKNPSVTVCQGGETGEEGTDETCSDHIDNDMDGHYDCDDHDCSQNSSVTVCDNPPNERIFKYHAADIDYGFQEMSVGGTYEAIVDTVPWGCVAQEPGNDSLVWEIKSEDSPILFTFSLPDASLINPSLYFYEASLCDQCEEFMPTWSYMTFAINGTYFHSEMVWECPGETNFGDDLGDFLRPGLNTIEVYSHPDSGLNHGLQGVHLEYEYCTLESGC